MLHLFAPLHPLAHLFGQFPDVPLFLTPSLVADPPIGCLAFGTAVPGSPTTGTDLVLSPFQLYLTAISRRALSLGNIVSCGTDPLSWLFGLPELLGEENVVHSLWLGSKTAGARVGATRPGVDRCQQQVDDMVVGLIALAQPAGGKRTPAEELEACKGRGEDQ